MTNIRSATSQTGIRFTAGRITAARYNIGRYADHREVAWMARWSETPDAPEPFDGDGIGGGDAAYAAALLERAGRKHDFVPMGKGALAERCKRCGETADARIAFDGSVIVAAGGRRVHTNPDMSRVWKHPDGEQIA